MAIGLLQTGQWHDKTKYQPKEEVLNYEKDRRIGFGNDGIESKASSEREEPGHRPHQCDETNHGRTEHSVQTIRSRSTNSEVSKKRGRPKKSN